MGRFSNCCDFSLWKFRRIPPPPICAWVPPSHCQQWRATAAIATSSCSDQRGNEAANGCRLRRLFFNDQVFQHRCMDCVIPSIFFRTCRDMNNVSLLRCLKACGGWALHKLKYGRRLKRGLLTNGQTPCLPSHWSVWWMQACQRSIVVDAACGCRSIGWIDIKYLDICNRHLWFCFFGFYEWHGKWMSSFPHKWPPWLPLQKSILFYF